MRLIGAGSTAGVEGAEHQVPRFSSFQIAAWMVSRVTHFTNEDDVRIHTQRAFEMPSEKLGHIDANFALIDHALLVLDGKYSIGSSTVMMWLS